jgi:hypothetical protein
MFTPARLSYTRSNDLACPFRFQALNMRCKQDTSASYTRQGKMHHEIAATYFRKLGSLGLLRSENIYAEIFIDHTARLPSAQISDMAEVGQKFCRHVSLKKHAEKHLVEVEMGINRDGEPKPVSELLHPDGRAREDCLTGIADYIGVFTEGTHVILKDWKFGNQIYEMDVAQKSRQLKTYAYLHMVNDPRCDTVIAQLYAPRFNSLSTAEFKREILVPEHEEWLAEQWMIIDSLRAEHGDNDWPAIVQFEKACNFCRDSKEFTCPKAKEFIDQWRARDVA